MTREEKLAVINGLAEQLEQYPHFYITNIEALNAEQTAKLRRKCFENNIKLVVVKNTLFGKALAPGVGDGQRILACCSPWDHQESDSTE